MLGCALQGMPAQQVSGGLCCLRSHGLVLHSLHLTLKARSTQKGGQRQRIKYESRGFAGGAGAGNGSGMLPLIKKRRGRDRGRELGRGNGDKWNKMSNQGQIGVEQRTGRRMVSDNGGGVGGLQLQVETEGGGLVCVWREQPRPGHTRGVRPGRGHDSPAHHPSRCGCCWLASWSVQVEPAGLLGSGVHQGCAPQAGLALQIPLALGRAIELAGGPLLVPCVGAAGGLRAQQGKRTAATSAPACTACTQRP